MGFFGNLFGKEDRKKLHEAFEYMRADVSARPVTFLLRFKLLGNMGFITNGDRPCPANNAAYLLSIDKKDRLIETVTDTKEDIAKKILKPLYQGGLKTNHIGNNRELQQDLFETIDKIYIALYYVSKLWRKEGETLPSESLSLNDIFEKTGA